MNKLLPSDAPLQRRSVIDLVLQHFVGSIKYTRLMASTHHCLLPRAFRLVISYLRINRLPLGLSLIQLLVGVVFRWCFFRPTLVPQWPGLRQW